MVSADAAKEKDADSDARGRSYAYGVADGQRDAFTEIVGVFVSRCKPLPPEIADIVSRNFADLLDEAVQADPDAASSGEQGEG